MDDFQELLATLRWDRKNVSTQMIDTVLIEIGNRVRAMREEYVHGRCIQEVHWDAPAPKLPYDGVPITRKERHSKIDDVIIVAAIRDR
jgi:hypothetical protein